MFWAPKDLTTLNFLANHTNGSEQPDGRTAQQQAGANMAKIQEVQRFARQVYKHVLKTNFYLKQLTPPPTPTLHSTHNAGSMSTRLPPEALR